MGEPLWRCVTDDLMTSYPRSFSDDLCFCSDISDVEPFHHFTCGKIANLTPMFVSWCLHARIYTAVNWRISNLGHVHNNWNFIGSTDRYWCDELNKIPLSTAPVVTVVCWIHSSCIRLYQSVSTLFGCLGYFGLTMPSWMSMLLVHPILLILGHLFLWNPAFSSF